MKKLKKKKNNTYKNNRNVDNLRPDSIQNANEGIKRAINSKNTALSSGNFEIRTAVQDEIDSLCIEVLKSSPVFHKIPNSRVILDNIRQDGIIASEVNENSNGVKIFDRDIGKLGYLDSSSNLINDKAMQSNWVIEKDLSNGDGLRQKKEGIQMEAREFRGNNVKKMDAFDEVISEN